MDYETAKNNLEELIKWSHENNEALKRNEATTRFHLIDRLLENCLGWTLDQFELERAQNGEYTDYELGRPVKRLIVELPRIK